MFDDSRSLAIKEKFVGVIPGREFNERTRNLQIPGSMLRIAPE
jgi:hypothetical protein